MKKKLITSIVLACVVVLGANRRLARLSEEAAYGQRYEA